MCGEVSITSQLLEITKILATTNVRFSMMAVTVTSHQASQYTLLPDITVGVVRDQTQVCHVLVSSVPAGGVFSAAGVTSGDKVILSGKTGVISVILQKRN